jgi:hypothetical protein
MGYDVMYESVCTFYKDLINVVNIHHLTNLSFTCDENVEDTVIFTQS